VWWSDTLWVTLIRLWPISLWLSYLQSVVVEFLLQSHSYVACLWRCCWIVVVYGYKEFVLWLLKADSLLWCRVITRWQLATTEHLLQSLRLPETSFCLTMVSTKMNNSILISLFDLVLLWHLGYKCIFQSVIVSFVAKCRLGAGSPEAWRLEDCFGEFWESTGCSSGQLWDLEGISTLGPGTSCGTTRSMFPTDLMQMDWTCRLWATFLCSKDALRRPLTTSREQLN
jgi:hypothetical protein